MMVTHMRKCTSNQWGGENNGSLCGRLNKLCDDGMNITDDAKAVTCFFCLKALRKKPTP